MQKKIYTGIQFVAMMMLLASCQQRMYFPERANTPGLTEALEGKATISFKPQGNEIDSGYSGGILSPAVDLAFAPVNNFGIIASYRSTINRNIEEGQNILGVSETMGGNFNGHRFEFGAGYFSTFGRRSKFEVYGGYGNGFLKRRGSDRPEYDYDTRYYRFFIQPAVGFGTDRVSFTAGARFAIQKFYGFKGHNDPELINSITGSYGNVERITFPFFEPFVNFEVGAPYLKFNVQMGCGTQMGDSHRISGTAPFYISFGLVGHIAPRFFKGGGSTDDDDSGGRRRRR
jgi:hypothetical protein